LTQCKGPIPLQLQEAIGIKLAEKIAVDDASQKKRVYADLTSPDQSSLVRSFATQASPIADSAILRFIVSQGLAPSLVNDESFKNMLTAVRATPINYAPPTSHSLGINTVRSTHASGFGKVLEAELVRCSIQRPNVKWSFLRGSYAMMGLSGGEDRLSFRSDDVQRPLLLSVHGRDGQVQGGSILTRGHKESDSSYRT
jgi:hypothetical protein